VAAAKAYQKEMLAAEAEANAGSSAPVYNIGELMNEDEELQKLHEERIEQLKSEQEKRVQMQRSGHGQLTEVTEADFLEVVTKTEAVVCHFFHRDFERCKIMDKHLVELARKHFDTKFIKMSAPDAPFFTVKLDIKMLPCLVCFLNGNTVLRVVGFDGLGGVDDFETWRLEEQLIASGTVVPKVEAVEKDDRIDGPSGKVRKGFQPASSDEDSDFD